MSWGRLGVFAEATDAVVDLALLARCPFAVTLKRQVVRGVVSS